ncbi:MAG: hypothetical protein U9N52_13375 [Campylobacterota bacterium]|nr:hypothetical protein [Campylobacterota bacterium]
MTRINWDEYKAFKAEYDNPHGRDNFGLLIEFLKSFYNVNDIHDLYDSLLGDELSRMMLEKRRISNVVILEKYLNKKF